MTYSLTSPDAVMLDTRIPETHQVEGLEYGRHLSGTGWSGYYVRPEGVEHWGIARQTPASDEIHDSDAEIVEAIREEIAEVHEAIQDATEQGFTSLELGGVEYTWTISETDAATEAAE